MWTRSRQPSVVRARGARWLVLREAFGNNTGAHRALRAEVLQTMEAGPTPTTGAAAGPEPWHDVLASAGEPTRAPAPANAPSSRVPRSDFHHQIAPPRRDCLPCLANTHGHPRQCATVQNACTPHPKALSIRLSDQVEQLDALINAQDTGHAFFERTHITDGMQDLITEA